MAAAAAAGTDCRFGGSGGGPVGNPPPTFDLTTWATNNSNADWMPPNGICARVWQQYYTYSPPNPDGQNPQRCSTQACPPGFQALTGAAMCDLLDSSIDLLMQLSTASCPTPPTRPSLNWPSCQAAQSGANPPGPPASGVCLPRPQ
jgi:hypothetical protein